MRLTAKQRAALVALADGGQRRPWFLAEALGTSPEGAARTASSLVTRGLVARGHHRRLGLVFYVITGEGLEVLDHHQQELTP